MKFPKIIALFLLVPVFLFSCKKWSDPVAPDDPRLDDNRYCNDPDAVNYNWNFPGVPDSSVCIFPADLFKGIYSYTDSIYNSESVFDSAKSQNTYTLYIIPLGKRTLRVVGFCGSDSLEFTAERSTYRATADTTIFLNDTTKVFGQFFCRTQDTLSGYFMKSQEDSISLKIDFLVVSDTGAHYHRGTAIKQ